MLGSNYLVPVSEVEAVQKHVYLTNIPVWFALPGDIKDGRM